MAADVNVCVEETGATRPELSLVSVISAEVSCVICTAPVGQRRLPRMSRVRQSKRSSLKGSSRSAFHLPMQGLGYSGAFN